MTDKESRIRERAYSLWQSEGRPAGREQDHWEQASREISEEDQGLSAPGLPGTVTRNRKSASKISAAQDDTASVERKPRKASESTKTKKAVAMPKTPRTKQTPGA